MSEAQLDLFDEVEVVGGIEASLERPECLVDDPNLVGDVFNALSGNPLIAFDTETTGLDYMRDHVHGISFAIPGKSWYICNDALIPAMSMFRQMTADEPRTLWVGHNIKYDLAMVRPYNIRPKFIADTMVGQWLVDENSSLKLKDLAKTRLGRTDDLPTFSDLQTEYKKILGRKKIAEVTIYDIPVEVLAPYGARDSELTLDLYQKLRYDLREQGLKDLFTDVEMPFIYTLLDMEMAGLYVNQTRIDELREEWGVIADTARERFDKLSGGVNPNSSPQLAELLFNKLKLPVQNRTGTGKASTDALVLQRLEPLDNSGIISALREYRKYEKLIGTYLEMLQEKPYEGRVHGSFNQCGTVTGRLSSSDPNLQNIPSKGELGKIMRSVFTADPREGTEMVVVDYSQIELRLLAHFSQEPNFLRSFREGLDPHQNTADKAHVERYVGKTINFSWAYGCGPRKLADTIEKNGNPRPSESDARLWLDSFNNANPTLIRWKESLLRKTRQTGTIKTLMGRYRHLPDINSYDKGIRAAAERQTINSLIQGSASDLIKYAMGNLAPWCDWYGAKMCAQVHDELAFEVPKSVSEEFSNVVQHEMEGVAEKFGISVHLDAEPGRGVSWGEAKH